MATVEGERAASRVESTMKRYRPEAVPHKGRAAQGYEALRTWADGRLVISAGAGNPCGMPRWGNPCEVLKITLD